MRRCSRASPACAAMQACSASRMQRCQMPRSAARPRGSSGSISISSSGSGVGTAALRSYYLTGFLHERPLARLRADLSKLGIARTEGQAEPEDHAAILCEIMAGLVSGRFPAPRAPIGRFLSTTWPVDRRFFADLERAEAADFYRRLGTLGRVFIDIEKDAFALPS